MLLNCGVGEVFRVPWTAWRSNLSSTKYKVKSLLHVRLFVIPWTIAYQAPLSMAFSRRCVHIQTPGGSHSKESACSAGASGLILGLGRSLGERNGNPLRYPCLEICMDRRAYQGTAYGFAKSQTQLSN